MDGDSWSRSSQTPTTLSMSTQSTRRRPGSDTSTSCRSPLLHPQRSRMSSFLPAAFSAVLHKRKRRLVIPVALLTLVLVALCTTNFMASPPPYHPVVSAAEELAEALAWNASRSVLVSHSEPLTCLNHLQRQRHAAGLASETVMRRSQLPSWTMHVVEAECTECLDSATHAAALKRQLGNGTLLPGSGAAVFATPSAPLGLAGPMLFAMASVTDDVAVDTELARWGWVGRSKAVRRQFAGASPVGLKGGTTPYLVVMGIPSVDQPVRATLRDAQRATWLSYRDVARSENGFDGALLPLYIFAAAERDMTQGVTDVSPLLPTVWEYEAASKALLLRENGNEQAVSGLEERRVELVPDMRSMSSGDARLYESPCARIVTRAAATGTGKDTTWVSRLSASLQLPVRPAAVAPAALICHASTALWQEALAHRNVLWVDMMTDRRPTTKKKMGEGGNWGLPVEVGMTQKLILWLEYAYHAFPDVPYIMKSDDDTYLKAPQFVRDIRYIRAGFRNDRMQAPVGQRDPIGIEETEECIYWGGWARNPAWNNLRYHGGNGYMLHRRLVQAAIEDTNELNARTLRYAVMPFNPGYAERYEGLLMNVEDMFVGRMMRDKRSRLREVCPFNRAVYIEETNARLVDTHIVHMPIGWAGLLLHHVSPFDEYYLHYYFQHEYAVAERIRKEEGKAEELAIAEAIAYMEASVPNTTVGYGRYTNFQWAHPEPVPFSYVSPGDNVSVYSVEYETFPFRALDLSYHFVSP